MVDYNHSKEVNKIIAYLKEQSKKNEESPSTKQDTLLLKTTSKDAVKEQELAKLQQYSQYCSQITVSKAKKELEIADSINAPVSNNSNNDVEIINLISKKSNREQPNIDHSHLKDIDTSYMVQNNSLRVKTHNLWNKKIEEHKLDTSGEIIRKSNYISKQNYKKLKVNHTIDSRKQQDITDFFSVIKSVNNHGTNKEYSGEKTNKCFLQKLGSNINKSENSVKESRNLGSLTLNSERKTFSFPQHSDSPKSKQRRLWDIFKNIKKRNEPLVFTEQNSNIYKTESLQKQKKCINKGIQREAKASSKENTYENVIGCKRTFDDFCNKIYTNSDKKLKNEMTKLEAIEQFHNYSKHNYSNEGNHFLKSFSTGNMTEEKENNKDTNSLPITGYEMRKTEKKLKDNKTTFEDFIEGVLKKIETNNSSENENTCQKSLQSTNNSEINNYSQGNLEKVIKENNMSIKDILNSLKDRMESQANSSNDKPEKLILTEHRDYSKMSKISECKEQLHTSSFQNIIVELKQNIKNSSSANSSYKYNQDIDRSAEPTPRPIVLQDSNSQVDYNRNTKTPECREQLNNLSDICNSTIVSLSERSRNISQASIPILSQQNDYLGSYNKMTETSEYHEQLCNSSLLSNKFTKNNENFDTSTAMGFSEYDQDSDLQKYLIRNDFRYSSQNIEMCYPQSILNHEGNGKTEDFSQPNRSDLILDKDHTEVEVKSLSNEQHCSTEEFYNCVCDNNSPIPKNSKSSLKTQIELLEDGLEKSVLTATYKHYTKNTEKNCKLNNFVKNVIPNIENKDNYDKHQKSKFHIKRYKKGKIKVYKIKTLKKKYLRAEEINEELNLQDMLKKITSEHCETKIPISRFKSGSSISTSSSYILDDSKSDVLSTGSKDLTSPQQRLRTGFNELSKDKSLRYSEKEWRDVSEHDKEYIKMKLQEIFFQVLEDFKNKRTSHLRHRRQTFANCIFKDGRLQLKPLAESSITVISSRAQRSKVKFQLMLYIMNKIQTLLETDTKLTKRELYYQLKALISDQRVTDRAISSISSLLDVGMWALNIIAQKGLVFGDLKLLLSSGEMLNCNIPGTLIPQDINDIVEVHSPAYFILVVEKESIFHKLIEEDLPNKLTRPFIMITGKGYPDLNTQLFLRKLWIVMSIPVFIMVDADPHGINIMLNYRFGSVNNAHVSHHLAVPNAKWLGVYPSEVVTLNIPRQPLSEREIKLVNSILRTPYMEFSPKLVDELHLLLTKKYKAGIEGLIKTDSYLSEVYLPNKFFTHNFI